MDKENNPGEENITDINAHRKHRSPAPRKLGLVKKASHQSDYQVQRWLQEQSHAWGEHSKPPFKPTFLVGQRDAPWLLSALECFYEEDLITDVLHVVKSGKEATVYCCQAHPAVGTEYLAAKIYHPGVFRGLKNNSLYRQNRVMRDVDGKIVRNNRRLQSGLKSNKKKNDKERATQVSSWIKYEFQIQQMLYEIGADVPQPVEQIGNAILMEYIGNVYEPAPRFCEVVLSKDEAETLFEDVIHNIELWLSYDCIHGDLSEYNILYKNGKAIVIDFAQAVDAHQNPAVYSLLERDIERVCHYFAQFGITTDAHALAAEMWAQHMVEPRY